MGDDHTATGGGVVRETDSDGFDGFESVVAIPTDSQAAVIAASDGSRRRTALAVVATAVVAGLIGTYIGHRIQSPADRAAARLAPEPSLITVPVERRTLSSELVLAGQVAYNEPTAIQLAGSVGIDGGEAAVVTGITAVGEQVHEGDELIEVTGRPVIALQGSVPMYRRLVIGSAGPDVTQLEEALVRLGYTVSSADSVFDAETASAVEQMYSDAGFVAMGPSVEERDALTSAQAAVRQAEENVAAATAAATEARRPMLESERLQITQAVDSARAAVPAAEAAAQAARVEGDQSVATAQAARDAAQVARNVATDRRNRSLQADVDPDTGEPYTADRLAGLEVEQAQAQESLTAAEGGVVTAQTQRGQSVAAAAQAVVDALFQLRLAETQYAEASAADDTTTLDEAVNVAVTELDAARAGLAGLQTTTGLRIPPGEIAFVPVLPSTVTEMFVVPGSPAQGQIGTLATTDTLVSARVSRVDSALVAVGAAVAIDIRGSGVTTTGLVGSVGAPAVAPSGQDGTVGGGGGEEGGGGGGGGGEATGRLEVVVIPDDPDVVRDYVFWDARIVVDVASTDGEVLVVPVAAISVGPDEVSQVEIERKPATEERPAETELVDVVVGLASGGLAEVRPIEPGTLDEGDRVVVGVETNERLNEDEAARPSVPVADEETTEGSGTDGSGTEGSGTEGSGTEGSSSATDSPLAALLGFDSNPVEDRRRQLEVEERTADCMREQGYEYEPVDYAVQFGGGDDLQFTDPAAFGEQFGYGVMRNYELYESGDGGPEVTFDDPNQDYVNSLGPDDQQTYYEALYGEPMDAMSGDIGSSGEFTEPPPEQRGCNGIASEQVFGSSPGNDPEVQAALEDYSASSRTDPRLVDAESTWSECMGDVFDEHGIDPAPTSPDDMYGVVDGLKMEALGLEVIAISSEEEMNQYFDSDDGSGGQTVYSATTGEDGSGFVYLGQPRTLTAEEIDRFTVVEVDLWTQDQACQDTSGLGDVRRQMELDIVDQLTSQFPELAD